MKPIFDISSKQSFTVWESGCWQPHKGFGTSVLVSGPATEHLQIIYDRNVTRSNLHALFYANVGNILAGAYVRKQGHQMVFHLDLVRIDSITTEIKQGNPVPKAETTALYISRKLVAPDTPVGELVADMPDFPSLPNAKELMELAISKALTPLTKQKIFWGTPRQPVTSDE